jgi:hypothetical protein
VNGHNREEIIFKNREYLVDAITFLLDAFAITTGFQW